MKIKHLLPVLCALAVFSSVSLMAQSDPDNSSTPTATASALHVGQNNPYKIGTSEDPVIPEEYCAYLMTSRAPSDSYWYPVHYEPSFMRVGNWLGVDRQACILRSGESGQYTYTVIPGHENDIIDGVQSEQAQQEFNNWRQNPKATELCEFMNDQISGDVDAANRIKNKYGAATFSIFDQLTIYANNYVTYYLTSNQWYVEVGEGQWYSILNEPYYTGYGSRVFFTPSRPPQRKWVPFIAPIQLIEYNTDRQGSIAPDNTQRTTLLACFIKPKNSTIRLKGLSSNQTELYDAFSASPYLADETNSWILANGLLHNRNPQNSPINNPRAIELSLDSKSYYRPSSIELPSGHSDRYLEDSTSK